jgi:hypothetical protein
LYFTAWKDTKDDNSSGSSGGPIPNSNHLPNVSFDEIASTFNHLASRTDLTERLNKAYQKNLVYKDAFANKNGGPLVDMKHVLDLSPEPLNEITQNNPGLVIHQGAIGVTLKY